MVIEKVGTEVHFRCPIKTMFQIESDNRKFAISLAIDQAKSRYPNLNWENPIIMTTTYKYNEIVW